MTAERLSYIITVKCAGRALDALMAAEIQDLLPDFMRVLDAIHNVDIGRYSGYGIFDSRGTVEFGRWKDFILEICDDSRFRWSRLFQSSFFERGVFEQFFGAHPRVGRKPA